MRTHGQAHFTTSVAETKEVRRLCREAGVLVGAGGTFANVIRLQPPLTLSTAEADRICDAVSDAVAKTAAGKWPVLSGTVAEA